MKAHEETATLPNSESLDFPLSFHGGEVIGSVYDRFGIRLAADLPSWLGRELVAAANRDCERAIAELNARNARTPKRFPLHHHVWCHTGMEPTTAEANKDRPHFVPFDEAEALRKSHDALVAALEDCSTRFERCCIHSGSDKEFAAHAVEDYRALIKAAKEKA